MRQLCLRLSISVIALVGLAACRDRNDRATNQVAGYAARVPAAAPARKAPGRAPSVASDVVHEASVSSTNALSASDTVSTAPTAIDPAAMLIRTATAAVEVERLDPAIAAARQAAARFGGVVANAQIETGRNEVHRAELQIKVPAARFDSLLAGLNPLGRVESVAVTADDVGQEYVDIEARLINLRRLETRLIDLLANRTGKLSDVLSVERELARVRGEIEQIEGRRRYLQRSVALSTLQLTLHEPEPLIAGNPGSNPIAVAFREAWRYFVATIAWCITALGVLIPFAIVVLGLALLARWVKRRLHALGVIDTASP